MGPGLLNTFDGRVAICVVLLILGGIVTLALTLVVLVRKAPSIGELGRWFLVFAAICVGPPLLALIAVASVEVFHRAPVWVWPLVGTGVIGGLVAWIVLGRQAREMRDNRVVGVLRAQDVEPIPAMPAEPGWSMPDIEGQWDR